MNLEYYQTQREFILAEIIEKLSTDERFVAGWLTGSLSRNEADSLSDIDLTLVVSDKFSTSLCTRLEQVSAQTSPERLTLFSQFGTPALLHENNNNAPEGGTFTFVLYAKSAIMIDWILVPQSVAIRPIQSRLLFEKTILPMEPAPQPEDFDLSKKSVAEQWAFFWMMVIITIKYIQRGDGVFAAEWIEHLHGLMYDIERRLNRDVWRYKRGSHSKLQSTREKQLESIRELCRRMQGLESRVTEFTGLRPVTPSAEIEVFLTFAQK
ncbi:MAG TPA: hypothetical protein VFQ23_12430 [Anaerolineales bacterium]|nr:hypothetical protein [Anaerolineales bacterium]